MSVSKSRLQDFVKFVKNHEAFDEIMTRMQKRLFDRWVVADEKERKIIGDISNNQGLFVKELNTIFDSIDDDKPVNADKQEK